MLLEIISRRRHQSPLPRLALIMRQNHHLIAPKRNLKPIHKPHAISMKRIHRRSNNHPHRASRMAQFPLNAANRHPRNNFGARGENGREREWLRL